jgi:hypothetical protein
MRCIEQCLFVRSIFLLCLSSFPAFFSVLSVFFSASAENSGPKMRQPLSSIKRAAKHV